MSVANVTQTGQSSTVTVTVSRGTQGAPGAQGPPGSDATVTTEAIETALGYTPADAATNTGTNTGDQDLSGLATQSSLAAETAAREATSALQAIPNLAAYRKALDTNAQPRIVMFGDSMIGTAYTELSRKITSELGVSGHGFLSVTVTSPASAVTNDCTKWITGNYYTVPATGILEFAYQGILAVEGNKLTFYYLSEPGAGTFKIQSQKYGGSWTDETGYTAVDADDTLAGQVITITKTDYRARWKLRIVGVSGTVKIIGAGIRDTQISGAVITFLTNSSQGSNNLEQQAATPTAITNPIFADLAPSLVILSTYDGATAVETYQATVQDNIIAGVESGSADAPSFLCVGPPPGYDDASDILTAAQAVSMRALAKARGDAFFDNREWALPITTALSLGYLIDNDVHFKAPAMAQWVTAMWQELGLSSSPNQGAANLAEFSPRGGGKLRAWKHQYGGNYPGIESTGALVLAYNSDNTTSGRIYFEDEAGPSDGNDVSYIESKGSNIRFRLLYAPADFIMSSGSGSGTVLNDESSTANSPKGLLGSVTKPLHSICLGKTITAGGTTTAQTINKSSGRVNLAASESSKVVTNSLVSSTSIIIATIATDDATATSVKAIPSAGSFTLKTNAATTGETAVAWMILP